MEQQNIIIKSLGLALKTEIKYISLAITLGKSREGKSKYEEKTLAILLGKDKIFLLLADFQTVKLVFEYDAIDKVYLDLDQPTSLMIYLDTAKLPPNTAKYESFYLFVKDRSVFVKSLICYHSIYFMDKYGIVSELHCKEKSFMLTRINREESLLSKGKEILHNHPEGFQKFQHKGGFEFFLKNGFSLFEDYIIYPALDDANKSIKIKIQCDEIRPVDQLSFNKDDRDVYYVALNKVLSFMSAYHKCAKFWITKTEYYNKKFNLTIDKSRWEAFRIEVRTNKLASEIIDTKEWKDNLVFIFLRRKYIPPFRDAFQDIFISLCEPYSDSVELHPESELIIETIADSIYVNEKFLSPNEYEDILESKVESLLLDEESLEFFYNNLKIYGNECYKYGMDYLYKLLMIIEESPNDRDRIIPIRGLLWEKIVEFNESICRRNDVEFDAEEHEKQLYHQEIDTFIRDFTQVMNTLGSPEYFNKMKTSWDIKMWRYLAFCVDGGISNDRFNLELLLEIYKNLIPSGTSQITHQIQIQVNNMLNLRIYNYNGDKLDSKISTIINQINDIKLFDYNENVMNTLIKTGTLKYMQSIDSDTNFSNFIKFMLDNNPSIQFLKALGDCLKQITLQLQLGGDDGLRKSLNTALPSFMNIYSSVKISPLAANEACKCLCILTCAPADKNNRTRLLTHDVISIITAYLEYPDEKLLFGSLKLLNNILPELKESITEILYKNQSLIPKLVEVLSGTKVPKTYHALKTIQSVVIILLNLLKMHTLLVREKLKQDIVGEKTNGHFIDYLLWYLNEDADKIGETVQEEVIPLQGHIFTLFDAYSRKNFEIKKEMNEGDKIEKLVNDVCEKNMKFLELLASPHFNPSLIKGDSYEIITAKIKKIEMMLTFTFYFLKGYPDLLGKFKSIGNKSSLFKLIEFAYENRQNPNMSMLSRSVNSIRGDLLDDDDDEDA